MLDEYRDIAGEEEVGVVRDEYLTDVGGRNAATDGIDCSTLCIPND